MELEMFQFWKFHDVFTCEVVYLSCFVLQPENFTSDLNSPELELRNSFSFTKAKRYHKFLIFGSKSYWLRTHEKDNINKKVRSIVTIHVRN